MAVAKVAYKGNIPVAKALKATNSVASLDLVCLSLVIFRLGGAVVLVSRRPGALSSVDEECAEAALRRLAGCAKDSLDGAALGAMEVSLQGFRIADPDGVYWASCAVPFLEVLDVHVEFGPYSSQLRDRVDCFRQ